MGSNQSNTSSQTQTLENNILQATSESCQSNCTNIQEGQTIVINGSSIGGNIELNQQCTAQASCIMRGQIGAQVQSILNAMTKQSAVGQASMFQFSFENQNQSSDISQNVTNTITQVMTSSCQGNSNNLEENNTVVLSNSRVGGDFVLSQKGSSTANCTMNNLSKIVLFNQETAKTKQSEKVESLLGGIIAIIILLIVIGGIAAFVSSGKKKRKS